MTDNLANVYSNTQTDTSYFQAFLNKILLSFCVLEYTVAKLSVIYFDLNFFLYRNLPSVLVRIIIDYLLKDPARNDRKLVPSENG